MQRVELDGSAWRALAPHPPLRLITRATGGVVSLPPANPVGGSLNEHFLKEVDPRGSSVSLGRTQSAGIPDNQESWAAAYLYAPGQLEAMRNVSTVNYARVRSSGLWTVESIPDVSNFWWGTCFDISATVPGIRGRLFGGVVWKLGNPKQKYVLIGNGAYAAYGLGASGSAGVGIFCGFNRPEEMIGWTSGQMGLQLTAGGKWTDFLKVARRGGTNITRLQQVIGSIGTARNTIKGIEAAGMGKVGTAKDYLEIASRNEKLVAGTRAMWAKAKGQKGFTDAIKAMDSIEFAQLVLTCAGYDGTQPGMDFLTFGGGGELSVYAGYSTIQLVVPL